MKKNKKDKEQSKNSKLLKKLKTNKVKVKHIEEEPVSKPCTKCNTTGGFIGLLYTKPRRIKGLCMNCYSLNRYWKAKVERDGV